LDALTQNLEVFTGNQPNPLTDAVCREGLRRARSLRVAWEDGRDIAARRDMCLASLCGGLGLANAKLKAVHGFAGPLGGMYPAPHGAVCARLLPYVMRANIAALRERGTPGALDRYDEVGRLLTDDVDADADAGAAWIEALCERLNVPPLSAYGVTRDAFDDIVAKARRASSMKGNPVELSDGTLRNILERAL